MIVISPDFFCDTSSLERRVMSAVIVAIKNELRLGK
jgi:hypothetical protein